MTFTGECPPVSFTSTFTQSNRRKAATSMGDTGIVRRVDDLGRIVLPMELRRTLDIRVKDPLSITVEGDRIVLQRPRDVCALCGQADDVVSVKERSLCSACIDTVKRL